MGVLEGRVAVITGAAGGLGREYTKLFLREGALVVAVDLPAGMGASPFRDLSEEFSGTGRLIIQPGDVSDPRSAEEIVASAVSAGGHLDVLVNNAGNFREGPLVDFAVDDFDALMRVHVRGHFLMARSAARHWKARSDAGESFDASLINTTSRSALKSIPEHSAYAAAKSAVITFSTTLAAELRGSGVRVNCVAPFARTAMTQGVKVLDGVLSAAAREHDEFDPFDPANVAPIVAYLATSTCPLTGEVLFAHGGEISRYEPWQVGAQVVREHRLSVAELAQELPTLFSGSPSNDFPGGAHRGRP